jgi:MoaA/NifB/PqqE/SkfB family radical SAM enzyme
MMPGWAAGSAGGECEFREICGGSRARDYALTGDPFAEEPCCVYQPRAVGVPA